MSDTQKSEPIPDTNNEWQTILQKNIDVLKEASAAGDIFRVSFFRKTLDANAAPYTQMFAKYMTMNDDAQTSSALTDLQKAADTANDSTQKYADGVQDNLVKFSATSEGQSGDQDAWKNTLNKSIDKAKSESDAMWERARVTGLAKIGEMPPGQRNGAASLYSQALGAVGKFVANIGDWLNGALAKIWDFLKGVWDKIVGFGKQIAGWASGAFNTIKSVFGGIFSLSMSAPDVSSSVSSSPPGYGIASAGFRPTDEKALLPPWWLPYIGTSSVPREIEKIIAELRWILMQLHEPPSRGPKGDFMGPMVTSMGDWSSPTLKITGGLID